MTQGDLTLTQRLLRSLVTTIIAGLAGLAVHSMLMLAKNALGILPGFQPNEDFQRLLWGGLGWWATGQSRALSDRFHGLGVSLCPAARASSRPESWARGFGFAFIAWVVMSTGFFQLVGHGLFGLRLGYGSGAPHSSCRC